LYENRKMRPVKTVPGTGRGAVKENDGGRWIQLWYIVRTLVNVTMYLHTTIIFLKRSYCSKTGGSKVTGCLVYGKKYILELFDSIKI
jgi:hypothetical protein